MNRSQEVIDDKVGYLAAHAIAAGQVGAEMNAGKNPTHRRFFIRSGEIGE